MSDKLFTEISKLNASNREDFQLIDLFVNRTDVIAQNKEIKSFILFGVGGVGTNLVEVITNTIDCYKHTIAMFDDDEVEFHNLNRTKAFTFNSIGQYKTDVCKKYIQEFVGKRIRNQRMTDSNNLTVMPCLYSKKKITKDINNPSNNMVSINTVKDNDDYGVFRKRQQMIFDCRDVLNSDFVIPGTFVKLSYNGASKISFHFKPEEILDNVINISNSYEVTPSFAVPPKILSIFAMYLASFDAFNNLKQLKAGYVELDIDEFIQENSFVVEYDDDEANDLIEELWVDIDADEEVFVKANEALIRAASTSFPNSGEYSAIFRNYNIDSFESIELEHFVEREEEDA